MTFTGNFVYLYFTKTERIWCCLLHYCYIYNFPIQFQSRIRISEVQHKVYYLFLAKTTVKVIFI